MVLTPSVDIELDLKAESNVKVWAELNVRAESKAGEEMNEEKNVVKIMITLLFYFQPNVILAGTDILIQCKEETSTCLVEVNVSEANFSLEAGTYN